MAPAPKFKFQEKELVLCYHGPLLYEAKCIKAEVKDKVNMYFVHYSGWNNKWDEWVPEARVLKVNDASLRKQAELQLAQQKARKEARNKKKEAVASGSSLSGPSLSGKESKDERVAPTNNSKDSKSSSKTVVKDTSSLSVKEKDESGPSSAVAKKEKSNTAGSKRRADIPSTSGKDKPSQNPPTSVATALVTSGSTVVPVAEDPKKKRTKQEAPVEPDELHYTQKTHIDIKIPENLKERLGDDWDFICRQKKLIKLPCEFTVDKILDEYVAHKKSSAKIASEAQDSKVTELVKGIRDYFNEMLGKHLLYKFERPQYAQLLQNSFTEDGANNSTTKQRPHSEVYGASHLLRMFTLLGRFLAFTELDEADVQILIAHLSDFLNFLSENAHVLCDRVEYVVASPEYHRRAL